MSDLDHIAAALRAADAAGNVQVRVGTAKFEEAKLADLKKAGMQVTELPATEVAKLRDKMKPVVEKHSASVGAAVVQEVQAELAKLRR